MDLATTNISMIQAEILDMHSMVVGCKKVICA
ncbi:hypothetical protein STSP2_00200 [Anaerohalosphaera lusitana]|uniref:Uncharacterized protein n=1 Tax=Anaerohalosphaera lusitana TaxID=1936003 RepID=A0A1U9NHH4_9BACT|nr:hypothetical protein STSP2_00200 [Anaerohalosphaera lusitana]